MKYLYFDVFASFSPVIAATSVADMLKSGDEFKNFSKTFCDAALNLTQVKRQGMEALYSEFSFEGEDENLSYDDILLLIKDANLKESVKDNLYSFVNVLSQAKSFDIHDAVFAKKEFIPNLISSAYVFEKMYELGIQTLFMPRIYTSCATKADYSLLDECGYILKKYGIKTQSIETGGNLLNMYGASFVAVCAPVFSVPDVSFALKIGYGAGEIIENMPNIVRSVYGESEEDSLILSAVEEFEDVFCGVEV